MGKTHKRKKHLWFKALCGVVKIFKGKNKFVFLGEQFSDQAIILSNHVGTNGPLSFELGSKQTFRCWGTYYMNGSLKELYKYQSYNFYHLKKGWNLHAARLLCLLAAPLTYLFYRGLNLISTYPDTRLRYTFKESLETLQEHQSIVIFPENSENGYLEELEGFLGGFIAFADYALKQGIDVPIYVTYLERSKRLHIVDAPVKFSELKKKYSSRDEMAAALCERCNELGRMARTQDFKSKNKIQSTKKEPNEPASSF